jgi:microsomal dipeptidase-like Zn-dependent dipeptidase
VSHALGSLNQNLPTFVAMQDVRGEPPNGKANWSNGFLPAQHQAVAMAAQQPLRNLSRPTSVSDAEETATREFLSLINSEHAERHPRESELRARMAAYELAARMQLAAPEVSDLSREPEHIRKLYGVEDANALKAAYARNCLLARRFLEQGVRYVSLYCASRASSVDGLLNWDAHKTLKSDYERHCPIFDQPTAALLAEGFLEEEIYKIMGGNVLNLMLSLLPPE